MSSFKRKYMVINFSELTDEVLEKTTIKNKDFFRKSKDNKVIISFDEDLPTSLNNKTILTHEEALNEMSKETWN